MSRSAQTFTIPGRPWLRPLLVVGAVACAGATVAAVMGAFSGELWWFARAALGVGAVVLALAAVMLGLGAASGTGSAVATTIDRSGLQVRRRDRTFLRCAWRDMEDVRIVTAGGTRRGSRPRLDLRPAAGWDAYAKTNPDARRFAAIGHPGALSIDLDAAWVDDVDVLLRRLDLPAYAGVADAPVTRVVPRD